MRPPQEAFLCATAGMIPALCARSPLFAQAIRVAARRGEAAVSVPFVGCASSGQLEILEAPRGTAWSAPIRFKDAQSLAYYRSADGIDLLAPRGWYCQGASGSGGYALYLNPKRIDHDGSGWKGLQGAVIESNHMTSGASGRYEIAKIMARVFPAYRAFAAGVMKGMDLPLPAGPYPNDTLMYRGKTIVEYNTPAQSDGLGNFDSWIGKNDLPIRGSAIVPGDPLDGDGPDLGLLPVRVPHALSRLIPVIVGQVERETVGVVGK
jgi:hypothetical protein